MKRILMGLMLLPLSTDAMKSASEETPVVIALTRDGEGSREVVSLSDNKEKSHVWTFFDRNYMYTIKYIVKLGLLGIDKGQATVKYSINVEQTQSRDSRATRITSVEPEVKRRIPVNIRYVETLRLMDTYPATLALTVLYTPTPKAKL